MNKSKIAHKLYLSVLWPVFILASLGFGSTIVAVVHDQIVDSKYSGDYFLASTTWAHGSYTWDTLPDEHIKALKRTAGDDTEGRQLGPWVTYSNVRRDAAGKYDEGDLKNHFIEKYNEHFWGFRLPWLS